MKYSAFIVLLIMTVSISGCFDLSNSKSIKYDYSINIKPDQTGNFSVYIPCLIHKNGTPIGKSIDLKIVDGKGDVTIINSEYGYAYNISSNNEIELLLTDDKLRDIVHTGANEPEIYLSLVKGEQGSSNFGMGETIFQIFFSSKILNKATIIIDCEIHSNPHSWLGISRVNGTINQGWNELGGWSSQAID